MSGTPATLPYASWTCTTYDMTEMSVCVQYVTEAKQLWQQALTACTPLTDVTLIVQAHKLLHTSGAIDAALGADGPQQSVPSPTAIPNGTAKVCMCVTDIN